MGKTVIRKTNGTQYLLVNEEIVEYGGQKFKDSYWLECDDNGNIVDSNNDGIVSNKTLLCKIPKGYDDLDLSTLNENCLDG